MKKLSLYLLISGLCFTANVNAQRMTSSAPGVLDAAFVPGRFFAFNNILDIGDNVWQDFYSKFNSGELKLTPEQDSIMKEKGQGGIYPAYISIPYLPFFYEDDYWSTRVYKTVNLETSLQGVFSDKGPYRYKWIRESDKSITTDTFYYELDDWIFKKQIVAMLKKDYVTTYLDEQYRQQRTNDWKMDTVWVDSLTSLMPQVNKMVIKEDYFYDKYHGNTGSKIIAVGFFIDDQKVLWTYFPELSYALRSSFMMFDEDLNRNRNTSYDDILKSNTYDIESISYRTLHQNHLYWRQSESEDQNVDVMTEMNALFWIDQMKDYIQANYNNYTGEVSLSVHDHLNMKATLESGQLQGDCDFVDQNGNIKVHATFKNHKAHGPYYEKWDNGKLKERGQFENGLKVGEWATFYDNKKKMGLRNYERGWMQGEQMVWHPNGKKYMIWNYDSFMLNGPFERYNDNGELMESGEFTNNFPDGHWLVNLSIPTYLCDIVRAHPDLDWVYPIEAFKDNVLSYELDLEQGDKPFGCPVPVYTCVSITNMSEVK